MAVSKNICIHFASRTILIVNLIIVLVFVYVAPVHSQVTDFDPESYSPLFEIGLGGGASFLSSFPDWSSDQYVSGRVSLTMRLLKGLHVQGGKEIASGSLLDTDLFPYGPHYRLHANASPFTSGSWLGIRLDIPLNNLKHDFHNIKQILVAGGLIWNSFNLQSKSQEYYSIAYGYDNGASPVIMYKKRRDRVADMKGYYLEAAARWQLNQDMTSNPDSWFGYYGIDAGMRYFVYNDSSRKYDTFMEPSSSFSGLQLFATLYLNVDIFY